MIEVNLLGFGGKFEACVSCIVVSTCYWLNMMMCAHITSHVNDMYTKFK